MARISGRLKRSQPEKTTQTPASSATSEAAPRRTARILPVDPPAEPDLPLADDQGQVAKEEVTMAEEAKVEEQESAPAQPVSDGERTDASGRVLHPWEVSPEEQAHAIPLVEEARDGASAEADEVEVEQELASNSTQHGDAPA